MVRFVINDAVMPKEAGVAVVHADFGDETLAEEIRFVFREMHVVVVAKRAIHNC